MKRYFSVIFLIIVLAVQNFFIFICIAETVTDSDSTFILGDSNSDGIVDIRDLVRIKKYASGDTEDICFIAADIDADSKISANDIIAFLKILLNKEASVLDCGKCGENLFWELKSDGELHIYGEGAMYDYDKYYTPSPWYKYREEPYISEDGKTILNSDGTSYLSTTDYYANNPNGYKVKNIVIDEGVTYIGDWAFYRVCVEELTFPEGVEETGIFCIRFSPCIKVVNLPDSLKILDDFAISRNYELETINIGNGLEKVGTAGFNANTSLTSLILPESCTQINKQLSPAYTKADINYSACGLMENCKSLKTVGFGSVEEIPQRTCLDTQIEEVIIPNTVKKIGIYAFYNCDLLKKVKFEENSICTDIAWTAFDGCSSLESVTGGISLKTLGNYMGKPLKEFDFSSSNTELGKNQFNGTSITTASVSDNITSIPVSWMVNNSSLETLYISNSVTEILSGAFVRCTSLNNIYFGGTLEEWKTIKKTSGWNYLVPSTCIIHFSDGTEEMLKNCN